MIWRRNKRVQQFSSSAHIDNFWQFQKQGFIPGQDSIPYPSHFFKFDRRQRGRSAMTSLPKQMPSLRQNTHRQQAPMARAAHKPRRNIRQYSPPRVFGPPAKPPARPSRNVSKDSTRPAYKPTSKAQQHKAHRHGSKDSRFWPISWPPKPSGNGLLQPRGRTGGGNWGLDPAVVVLPLGNGIRPTRRLVEKPAVAAGQTRVLLVQAVVGAEQDLAGECGHPAAELCWPRAPAPTRAAAATNPIPTADARAHAAAEGAATTANGGNAAGFNAATWGNQEQGGSAAARVARIEATTAANGGSAGADSATTWAKQGQGVSAAARVAATDTGDNTTRRSWPRNRMELPSKRAQMRRKLRGSKPSLDGRKGRQGMFCLTSSFFVLLVAFSLAHGKIWLLQPLTLTVKHWNNLALTALDSYSQALEKIGSYSPRLAVIPPWNLQLSWWVCIVECVGFFIFCHFCKFQKLFLAQVETIC